MPVIISSPYFVAPVLGYQAAGNIITSFAAPGPNVVGLAFDGTNLISADTNDNLVYVHTGVTVNITTSFDPSVLSDFFNGMAYDGSNLLIGDSSLHANPNRVYRMVGVSSTIDTYVTVGGSNCGGIAWDGTNLISHHTSPNTVSKHAGFSSTIDEDLTWGVFNIYGLTWDYDAGNLIVCNGSSQYIYDGFSTTEINHYNYNGTFASARAVVYIGNGQLAVAATDDNIYIVD